VKNNSNSIKTLTLSASALVLCVLCLLFFRGPMSLVSAFFIPVIIVIFAKYNITAYYVLTLISLFLITIISFQTQLIFVIGYILLALALRSVLIYDGEKVIIQPFRILIYLMLVSLILYISIRLTDLLFATPLHQMMLGLANNNLLVYFMIIFIESIFVALINLVLLKTITARVRFK